MRAKNILPNKQNKFGFDTFGTQFRRIMEQRGKTIYSLSRDLGMSESNLANHLRKDNLREEDMTRFCDALGVPFRVVVGDDQPVPAIHETTAPAPAAVQPIPPEDTPATAYVVLHVPKRWYARRNFPDDYEDNINPSERDLWEQFKQALKDGREIGYTLTINN